MRNTMSRSAIIMVLLAVTGPLACAQDTKKSKVIKPNKKAKAPAKFQALFETTKGKFVIEVHREWAPIGADRFYDAVKQGFYNDCAFFRVLPGFVVQFGVNGNPKTQKHWSDATIKDDAVKKSNLPGTVTFATAGPDTRTTQLFINYGDNSSLDQMGFAPFGKVVKGMEVAKKINAEYRQRPNQGALTAEGNAYLKRAFPRLDYIKKATIVSGKDKKKKDKS